MVCPTLQRGATADEGHHKPGLHSWHRQFSSAEPCRPPIVLSLRSFAACRTSSRCRMHECTESALAGMFWLAHALQ